MVDQDGQSMFNIANITKCTRGKMSVTMFLSN